MIAFSVSPDFGLCTFYKINGIHIKQETREVSYGRGTGDYMSLYAHKHLDQSRRDDVESILYMLIKFLQGKLPWRLAQNYELSVLLGEIFRSKSIRDIKVNNVLQICLFK